MMQMRSGMCENGDRYDCQPLYSDREECSSISSKAYSLSSYACPGAVGFIEHRISKMDTLAGIAIKYGVEVADVKRINGLGTDLQMFALKSLRIPTPGRHPPSPCLSNGSDISSESCSEKMPRRHSDLFHSFQSPRIQSPYEKVSPAMSSLQCYYGLQESLPCDRPISHHRKSRSLANGFLNDNRDVSTTESGSADPDKSSEKFIRRRQKSEADFTQTPEMRLDDSPSCSGVSVITAKGLALRPTVAGRATAVGEIEFRRVNPISSGLSASTLCNGSGVVRKSSSTSSLQDQDGATSSSFVRASTRWSLKPDFQSISAAAVARPIFDGLPKPITGRKNKAALD